MESADKSIVELVARKRAFCYDSPFPKKGINFDECFASVIQLNMNKESNMLITPECILPNSPDFKIKNTGLLAYMGSAYLYDAAKKMQYHIDFENNRQELSNARDAFTRGAEIILGNIAKNTVMDIMKKNFSIDETAKNGAEVILSNITKNLLSEIPARHLSIEEVTMNGAELFKFSYLAGHINTQAMIMFYCIEELKQKR